MDIKKDFRKKYIERRNHLTAEEVCRKSAEIFSRVCSLKEYGCAAVVIAYMSFGNEVMTRPFIEKCLRDGKRVALPRVMVCPGRERHLAVYEISDVTKDLIPGFKGILEPDPSVLEPMEPEEADLAVIPGVTFDRHCNRMGFGAGYYDRFLPKLSAGCLKAGVCFDMQLAERVPTDGSDIRVDMVVTESEIWKPGQYQ
ncbi:MAG: 5-formyltetrahydrofolate cyclo-ligase [Clostridiaceae bacterium]|nr:5-formyltetrahydrofolate cyclo-ligase [Clostridiaceae bacterium]